MNRRLLENLKNIGFALALVLLIFVTFIVTRNEQVIKGEVTNIVVYTDYENPKDVETYKLIQVDGTRIFKVYEGMNIYNVNEGELVEIKIETNLFTRTPKLTSAEMLQTTE